MKLGCGLCVIQAYLVLNLFWLLYFFATSLHKTDKNNVPVVLFALWSHCLKVINVWLLTALITIIAKCTHQRWMIKQIWLAIHIVLWNWIAKWTSSYCTVLLIWLHTLIGPNIWLWLCKHPSFGHNNFRRSLSLIGLVNTLASGVPAYPQAA